MGSPLSSAPPKPKIVVQTRLVSQDFEEYHEHKPDRSPRWTVQKCMSTDTRYCWSMKTYIINSSLSSHALDALKEFYAERDAREKQFEDLKVLSEKDAVERKTLSMEAFQEDWNESQFWVSQTLHITKVQ